jgi:hypothetical protein
MIPISSTMQSALLGYGLSDVLCFCVDHAQKKCSFLSEHISTIC